MRVPSLSVILVVAVHVGFNSVFAAAALAQERIAADTPKTTVAGNTFVAPAGWSLVVRGPATILEAPEGGSFIALVDVPAKDATTADAAVAAAWAAYKPDAKWPLKVDDADRRQGRLDRSQVRTRTRRRRTRSATSASTCDGPTTCGPSRSTTWRRRSARSAAPRSA